MSWQPSGFYISNSERLEIEQALAEMRPVRLFAYHVPQWVESLTPLQSLINRLAAEHWPDQPPGTQWRVTTDAEFIYQLPGVPVEE
jgi:hypothetical protein